MITPRHTLRAALFLSLAAAVLFTACVLAYARWGGVLLAEVNHSVAETELQHALDLHRGGFTEEAEIRYQQALEGVWAGEQNRAFALKEWGALLLGEERFEEAALRLQQAVDSPRTPISAYQPLLITLEELERWDEAQEAVLAWEADADAANHALEGALARYHQGRLLLRRGAVQAARERFETGHALHPGRGNALELARFAQEEGRHAQALSYLDTFFLTGAHEPQRSEGLRLRAEIMAHAAP